MTTRIHLPAAVVLLGTLLVWWPASSPALSAQATAQPYAAVDLGTLGGPSSYSAGINALGQVVGGATLANGDTHAFRGPGADGRLLDLGVLSGGTYSAATGVNASGQVVGYSETQDGALHAFSFPGPDGKLRDLGTLTGGSRSVAQGINASGVAVGFSDALDGNEHAVRWDGGTLTDLGLPTGGFFSNAFAINGTGQIVGAAGMSDGSTLAMLWNGNGTSQDLGLLPGGTYSVAYAINDAGVIAGEADVASGDVHAFLRTASGEMRDLGTFGGSLGYVFGLNAPGQAVGAACDANGDFAGLITTGPMAITDLNNYAGLTAPAFVSADAINDSGVIAATGHNPKQADHAFRLTPPPPAGRLTLTPSALAFGPQAVNTAVQLPVTLRNEGSAPLNVTVGILAAPFRVVSGGGGFGLQPGSTRQVLVEFRPTRLKPFSTTLPITSDEPGNKTVSYAVTGTGAPPPRVKLTPSALAFAPQAVNTSTRLTLTIADTGGAPLHVTVGTLPAPFRVVSGGGSSTVQPSGPPATVVVEFAPTQRKTYAAVLPISTDDPKKKSAPVKVTGKGA